jgi:hypothetical protein
LIHESGLAIDHEFERPIENVKGLFLISMVVRGCASAGSGFALDDAVLSIGFGAERVEVDQVAQQAVLARFRVSHGLFVSFLLVQTPVAIFGKDLQYLQRESTTKRKRPFFAPPVGVVT